MSPKSALVLGIVLIVLGALASILHLFKRTQTLGDDVDKLREMLSKLTGVGLVLVLSLMVACSSTQKTAIKSIATCAESAALDEAKSAVSDILNAGAANWRDQLDAKVLALGENVVACAVEDLAQLEAIRAASDVPTAQDRARAWLDEHGYGATP